MLKLQRVAWEKRTSLALSTLRRALCGKQRPETAEVLHALQVLEVHRQQATADGELRQTAPPLGGGSHPWNVSTEVQRVGVEGWWPSLWWLMGGRRLRFQTNPTGVHPWKD